MSVPALSAGRTSGAPSPMVDPIEADMAPIAQPTPFQLLLEGGGGAGGKLVPPPAERREQAAEVFNEHGFFEALPVRHAAPPWTEGEALAKRDAETIATVAAAAPGVPAPAASPGPAQDGWSAERLQSSARQVVQGSARPTAAPSRPGRSAAAPVAAGYAADGLAAPAALARGRDHGPAEVRARRRSVPLRGASLDINVALQVVNEGLAVLVRIARMDPSERQRLKSQIAALLADHGLSAAAIDVDVPSGARTPTHQEQA